jgi:hypothetical protein
MPHVAKGIDAVDEFGVLGRKSLRYVMAHNRAVIPDLARKSSICLLDLADQASVVELDRLLDQRCHSFAYCLKLRRP